MNKMLFSFDEIITACNGNVVNSVPEPPPGVCSVVTDSRGDCSDALFVPLKGESFDGHDFIAAAIGNGATAILSEKGRSGADSRYGIPVIEVEDTTAAYQDLACFLRRRRRDLTTVALTGSSGKTSVKEMTGGILTGTYGDAAVLITANNTNNQIGVPQNLFRLKPEHRFAVLEMGTNHHGEIAPLSRVAEPDVALITSIGRCHLENLGSLEGVAEEKSMIFSSMRPRGVAIIPVAGPGTDILIRKTRFHRRLTFGFEPEADVCCRYLGGNGNGSAVELGFREFGSRVRFEWRLAGAHQACNAAAAAAVAIALDIPPEKIAAGLAGCKLPGMRMRVTRRENGTVWINDAYNANPDSMMSSLQWLAEYTSGTAPVMVLGDMLELGQYSQAEHRRILEAAIKLFPGAVILATGSEMSRARKELSAEATAGIISCDNAEAAVRELKTILLPGMTVFLKGSRGMKLELIEQAL